MKLFHRFVLLLFCAALSACGGMFSQSDPAPSAVPVSSAPVGDVMRNGDIISIRLSGVPGDAGYDMVVQIPSSGTVSVPLLSQSFRATGRATGDLAADIAQAYRSGQIYTTPDVTVLPEERFVNVGGEVRGPSRVPYTPDLTLLSAINSCGGFTDYANRRHIRILRGQQALMVDAVKAARTPGADPALYPGDQIYISRTIF